MTTPIPKPTKQPLTGYQTRATLCIDLGNDEVKSLLQLPGSDEWERVQFPSRVQQVSSEQANSSCIQLSGGNVYLVGNEANVNSRTGQARDGKVTNAAVLTLHAIRLLTGFTINPFNCQVIFTTPSNKQFGSDVIEKLQRSHYVTLPADPGVIGSREQNVCIIIHKAVSQLEGYQSHSLVLDRLKGSDAWLLDIGGGTVIATQFNSAGRILNRSAHNLAGVHAVAESLLIDEALSHWLPKLPTIAEITEFLFTTKDKQAQASNPPARQAGHRSSLRHRSTGL